LDHHIKILPWGKKSSIWGDLCKLFGTEFFKHGLALRKIQLVLLQSKSVLERFVIGFYLGCSWWTS